MNRVLYQKQQPVFIITKSLYQYQNIKAETSDEVQPLENYANSTVAFDDMLLSKQEGIFDLVFTRGRDTNIDFYYISQSSSYLPKNTIRNNSNIIILFKQSLRDIIFLFHEIAGLEMKLKEWKELCHKAWENHYEYLQLDRFAKMGEGGYVIRNFHKTIYIELTPETKTF